MSGKHGSSSAMMMEKETAAVQKKCSIPTIQKKMEECEMDEDECEDDQDFEILGDIKEEAIKSMDKLSSQDSTQRIV